MKPSHLTSLLLTAAALFLCAPCSSFAAGFGAKVAPPRFELRGQPGQVLRGIVQIANAESRVAAFAVRTADWELDSGGGVKIHSDELQAGSCRPWTRIERHRLTLPPSGHKKYRFEVHIPEDAPDGECRFAILIGSAPDSEALAGVANIRLPVAGQIAVIVYVVVGDAKPQLEVQKLQLASVNGRKVPVVVLRNDGTAHGRPEGLLEGRDASGAAIDLIVSPSPILPGQTRQIPIWPVSPDGSSDAVAIEYPLSLKGPIEWEGKSHQIDVTLR